jgi:outer membrane protein assembly factor BamB
VRRPIAVAALALALVAAGGVAAWLTHGSKDHVSGAAATVPDSRTTPKDRNEPARRELVSWPTYGRDNARTHAAPFSLRPPFRRLWAVYGDSSFIEFAPIVVGAELLFGTDHGRVAAVRTDDGRVIWNREFGHCIAASLAATGKTVLVAAMGPPPCDRGQGELIAIDERTGRTRWRFVAGPIESSPLVVDNHVIVGSWDGKLYSLDVHTGRVSWSFATGGAVKGGPALSGHTVYFASYDGHVYAVDARTGRLRWRDEMPAGSAFYATPTLAYGRVYVGATDGTVYALAAGSGRQLWARSLGSFVYSPAAVAGGRVYIGSYDHRLYALAPDTGLVLWSFDSRGPVSGAPTVLGRLVYFSSCGSCSDYESNPRARRTYAVDGRTGRLVWSFSDGEYSPVVSDGVHLFLTGYDTVYALASRAN